MSTPSPTALSEAARNVETPRVWATLMKPFEVAGFWAAVALPFLYLPLVVTGPETAAEQTALVALVAAHVVALVLGHRHRAE